LPISDILPDGSPVSGEVLREFAFSDLDFDFDFPSLATLLVDAVQAVNGSSAASTSVAAFSPADTTVTPVDNQQVASLAIVCDDAAWSRSVPQYSAELSADSQAFPEFGALGSNIEPCAFWPNPPKEPLVGVTANGPSNILMLQNMRDPATPYAGALQMHADLGQRSRLVSVQAGGHGVFIFSSNQCAANAAAAYLSAGTFPSGDVVCPADPAPAATAQSEEIKQQAHRTWRNITRNLPGS
jgi:hypothetical protein